MFKRIEVDFHMADEEHFIAVTDEILSPGEMIVAYEEDGPEMLAKVERVDRGVVYFSEHHSPVLESGSFRSVRVRDSFLTRSYVIAERPLSTPFREGSETHSPA